jgi:hypothetical protein
MIQKTFDLEEPRANVLANVSFIPMPTDLLPVK